MGVSVCLFAKTQGHYGKILRDSKSLFWRHIAWVWRLFWNYWVSVALCPLSRPHDVSMMSSWIFCGSKIWSKVYTSSKMAAFWCTAALGWWLTSRRSSLCDCFRLLQTVNAIVSFPANQRQCKQHLDRWCRP